MKKTIKTAMAMAVLSMPAFARTTNIENPLFMPTAGQGYTRLGLGLMYKQADGTEAMRDKGKAFAEEFPIYRGHGELGYGITDNLTVRGRVAYTSNESIDRRGMSEGRIGLNYRVFDGARTNGWIWDIHADAVLGGISRLDATVIPTIGGAQPLGFDYDNYSNGRWGAWFGTQVGRTWDKFTGAVFGEVQHTFGNTNSRIRFGNNVGYFVPFPPFGGNQGIFEVGLPDSVSVTTGSTWEYHAGLRGFYELNDRWAFGGGFAWRTRAANYIKNVNMDTSGLTGAELAAANHVAGAFLGSMRDSMNEYIFSSTAAYQATETMQVALYAEYTLDSAEARSQNGTDIKLEMGVRLNIAF